MSFLPTEDQVALQEGIRDLCAGRFPLDVLREREGARDLDRDAWRELAAAGVFSLRVPESEGGLGAGMVEAALVHEELGGALIPGPLVATELAAARGTDGAADGRRIVGTVEAERRPHTVAHADAIDLLVVAEPDGLTTVDPAGLVARPVERPLDPLTPVAVVEELPDGEPTGDADAARRWRLEGAVLAAAQLVGIADELTRRSTEHAKQREQFGRPIGSFQAVKHLLAEMLVATEVTRVAVHAAAVHLDDPEVGDVERAVSGAKLLAGRAGVANGKTAVQVHGGMGFTWELDIHLFLKRAVLLAASFGSADEHAEVVAARY